MKWGRLIFRIFYLGMAIWTASKFDNDPTLQAAMITALWIGLLVFSEIMWRLEDIMDLIREKK